MAKRIHEQICGACFYEFWVREGTVFSSLENLSIKKDIIVEEGNFRVDRHRLYGTTNICAFGSRKQRFMLISAGR